MEGTNLGNVYITLLRNGSRERILRPLRNAVRECVLGSLFGNSFKENELCEVNSERI